MTLVPADYLQIVVDGCRYDLKILISQAFFSILQFRRKEPANLGNGHIIGQDGHSGKDSFPNIDQMALRAGEEEPAGRPCKYAI